MGGRYYKDNLNTTKLKEAELMKPTVLIISCHGEKRKDDKGRDEYYFMFEDNTHGSLAEKVTKEFL